MLPRAEASLCIPSILRQIKAIYSGKAVVHIPFVDKRMSVVKSVSRPYERPKHRYLLEL